MGAVTDIATKQVRDSKPTGSGGGGMETRLSLVELRITHVEKRLDKVEDKLDKLIDRMDYKFDKVDAKFDRVDTKFSWLIGLMFGMYALIIGGFITIASKLY